MIKALIFDFDGVLVSSEGPSIKFMQAIAAKHGVNFTEDSMRTMRGKAWSKILEEIIPDNPSLIATILEGYQKEYIENITEHVNPIEFTVNFIRDYNGSLPIAIASMSGKQKIELLIKHFGIYEKIALIVSRDEIKNHKPDPEIYLLTASKLKISPKDCLVFEDSMIGSQAAINAKMGCCVVLNGENNKEEFEGMKVDCFIATEEDLKDRVVGINK